jgi:FkbM family methyltransferase
MTSGRGDAAPPDSMRDWVDDLHNLVDDPAGVLHVGAHAGQEVPTYRSLGFDPVILVEPIPEYAQKLRNMDGVSVVEAAVSTTPGRQTLMVTAYDQASSLLPPIEHPLRRRVEVDTVRLDDIDTAGIELLVVDTQGSELDVLQSGPVSFPLVIVEVSETVRYRGGCDRSMVENHMAGLGYRIVGEYPHKQETLVDLAFRR